MDTPTRPPVEELLSHTLAFCGDCLDREDYIAAWQALCRAVSLAPNCTNIFCHRGNFALFLKDTEAAQRDFTAALIIDPRCSAAWSGMARCHWLKGESAEAEAAAERALGINPADEEAAQLKAELQGKRGKARLPGVMSADSRATSGKCEDCVPNAGEDPAPRFAGRHGVTETGQSNHAGRLQPLVVASTQHPWATAILPSHFAEDLDKHASQGLFKAAVQMVEIEVHTFCNRKCWFCSNTVVDRRSAARLMAPELYTSILEQLTEIDYERTISFSRYNEPFANPVIIDRIVEARARLPRAVLHSNTNGDYLKRDTLQTVADVGLNSLSIQCYLGDTEAYDHERVKGQFEKILKRLGLSFPVTIDTPGEWYEGAGEHRGLKIRVYGRNFAVNGTSRGDTVGIAKSYVRTSPCLSPFWHFYVDWNGSVMPCCNLRSEVPSHAVAAIAVLTPQRSIFEVFSGGAARDWRKHLASFDPKSGLCRGCSFVTTDYDRELESWLKGLHSREASKQNTSKALVLAGSDSVGKIASSQSASRT